MNPDNCFFDECEGNILDFDFEHAANNYTYSFAIQYMQNMSNVEIIPRDGLIPAYNYDPERG